MSTAIAKNLMAEMKLLGMLAAFDKALSDATRDQSSHSELVDTLLQAECVYRQERKTGSRIKAAKFTLRPAFDILERRAQGELGGLDAGAGLALLPIVTLCLQQRIDEFAVTGLVAGGVAQGFVEGGEHAEQFHLGHQVFGDCGTHGSKVSWVEVEGTGTASSSRTAAPTRPFPSL